jgi:hypothetical protein
VATRMGHRPLPAVGGRCTQTGHPLRLPSPTKLPRLGHFPPAIARGGRLAGPVFYMYMSFLWCKPFTSTSKARKSLLGFGVRLVPNPLSCVM